MNGAIGFWLRIALIAASGAFASNIGFEFYDPETETITVHVDNITALLAAVSTIVGWKGLHGLAKRSGGVT